jgi:hypothetical protein
MIARARLRLEAGEAGDLDFRVGDLDLFGDLDFRVGDLDLFGDLDFRVGDLDLFAAAGDFDFLVGSLTKEGSEGNVVPLAKRIAMTAMKREPGGGASTLHARDAISARIIWGNSICLYASGVIPAAAAAAFTFMLCHSMP